jgi:hypothetical protein
MFKISTIYLCTIYAVHVALRTLIFPFLRKTIEKDPVHRRCLIIALTLAVLPLYCPHFIELPQYCPHSTVSHQYYPISTVLPQYCPHSTVYCPDSTVLRQYCPHSTVSHQYYPISTVLPQYCPHSTVYCPDSTVLRQYCPHSTVLPEYFPHSSVCWSHSARCTELPYLFYQDFPKDPYPRTSLPGLPVVVSAPRPTLPVLQDVANVL